MKKIVFAAMLAPLALAACDSAEEDAAADRANEMETMDDGAMMEDPMMNETDMMDDDAMMNETDMTDDGMMNETDPAM